MLCKAQEVYDAPVTNWKSEYKRCLLDKTRSYMIEKFIFGKELLHSQRAILNHIKRNNTNVISKSRDIGYTSIMAAYVACEIALNCDESFSVMYIGCYGMACTYFRDQVLKNLTELPKELLSDENAKLEYSNNKGFKFGKACLKLTNGSGGKSAICSETKSLVLDCVIFDEVAFLDKLDVAEVIKDVLAHICSTYIIGSNPNHDNSYWYNFVKKYKDSSNYIEVPWYMNQLHIDGDYDSLTIITDADGKEEYRTNRWYRKRRHLYFNEDEFKEEYEAKVWKYKTIKEYV